MSAVLKTGGDLGVRVSKKMNTTEQCCLSNFGTPSEIVIILTGFVSRFKNKILPFCNAWVSSGPKVSSRARDGMRPGVRRLWRPARLARFAKRGKRGSGAREGNGEGGLKDRRDGRTDADVASEEDGDSQRPAAS